jgi:hypothetical protein
MEWIHLDLQGNPINPFARPPQPRCAKCRKTDMGDDEVLGELVWDDTRAEYFHETCI